MSNLTLPPLSLYIHAPWCVRKCPYCDFNSHQADRFEENGKLPEDAYLDQLLADLEVDLPYVANRPIQTAFIGGGTPSLMSPDFYYRLMEALKSKLAWVDDAEITMEANPGTFEQEKFAHFRQAGINRLSIGIQSFHTNLLKTLGRIHNREEAIMAVEKSRLAGFDNINLDLMHGLPDQSVDMALKDLQLAMDLAPEHLSWYQLTIEPNTEFYRRPPELPEDNTLWGIQDEGLALLESQGYQQYEVSANARAGKHAQHNLNYWRFGDYLGIGAGAHGKITLENGEIFRTRKTRHPNHYLSNLPEALGTKEQIETEDLPLEFMMNRLRLFETFDLADFSRFTYREAPEKLIAGCQKALELGFIDQDAWHECKVKTTSKGKLFLNELLEIFLP
ncbi:radical SAM family heme chaperone HemW [Marinomonas mediterranea]|jgi:coproporphyrinogen III oxidase, anaerobic (EC 1.3.99.22)|uniref:Heme chaperone HemW n=1 Tax=Marinomonas mediterranea (strain ATCC 700492 / JCM 21426 / NBRC 103028 / MMB-1) TaxID=717774 RepID=F2K026_MARM1|nr:radical SAM family heme chaperone HemW [Marinomonas mediterranea]ADZ93240.1 oxygen-independent coproporphyrinogen III oxidase [Marinomonas mediterranea MMB-1]WCN11128.1 radical SAM family heme chaperone HemW [Marinomonas mediterranea]WCN15191.1 radical SAM family heme chaperone HemW [Marinomonas mediterranea]WCN19235.1 radical SAM family heme chaperone HemW [Marinomonas mediterranea MMB-1]